jgi:DNA-binding NarL/FixJ family response regulator
MSGVEELNGCGRCFQILLLSRWTIFDNDDRIFSAVLNGANGYLLKNTLPARLLRALRKRSQAARRCLRSSRAHGAAVP